ncbi:putative glycolipid-binding domain-containing protein [Cryptosporangium arvum]|uniref:putative glycolipid-binding domain-containing protein n=1 Tax=Cryptosporangium arvum TaxID=80871 RepID=UPI000A046416|nr:putative glycolipid-binding domain-containing protein [Cryptosporangium arvum]
MVSGAVALTRRRDRRLRWMTSSGNLDGCKYVDIADTPFTNTLPVRRLGLVRGAAADITVAYVDGMDLQPWPEPQRYTRLDRDGADVYRFTSLDGGLTADLPVDAEGLVLDYPGPMTISDTDIAGRLDPHGCRVE